MKKQYNKTIKWVEECLNRQLTDVEKKRIETDCAIAEFFNTGSFKSLEKYGIKMSYEKQKRHLKE